MAILTPILLSLPGCANQLRHFARLGVARHLPLGEDRLAVDTYFEDATAALTQGDGGPKLLFELGRQTGGSGLVVSNHAVEDLDAHLRPRGSLKTVPPAGTGEW
jgi:hypothetical protein